MIYINTCYKGKTKQSTEAKLIHNHTDVFKKVSLHSAFNSVTFKGTNTTVCTSNHGYCKTVFIILMTF